MFPKRENYLEAGETDLWGGLGHRMVLIIDIEFLEISLSMLFL